MLEEKTVFVFCFFAVLTGFRSKPLVQELGPVLGYRLFLVFNDGSIVGWYGPQNFSFNCTLKKMDFFFRIFL